MRGGGRGIALLRHGEGEGGREREGTRHARKHKGRWEGGQVGRWTGNQEGCHKWDASPVGGQTQKGDACMHADCTYVPVSS